MTRLRAAAIQFEAAAGDKPANLGKIRAFVEEAGRRQVELAVFPECSITGYWFLRRLSTAELTPLAEPVPDGPSTRELLAVARRYEMTIGAGLIERGDDDALYNTYVVAMPDGRVVRHRKLHAFEHELVRSGSEYTVFDLPNGWRAGILICYDCNLVENVRATALLGAEVLIAPHQTGGCRSKNPHLMGAIDRRLWDNRHTDPAAIERELRGDKGRGWLMRWLPSRAHDNGLFLIFSNGIGVDDDEIRTGNAMILDPYGSILVETGKAGDDMVVADLDRSLVASSTGRKWIKARRPELYAGLAVRTGDERTARELKFEE
jgi:predicted amidohydrolase